MFSSLAAHCKAVVLFDTETTGLSFSRDEIIEFAAVRLELSEGSFSVTSEVDELIATTGGRSLPPRITELTGITDEMLRADGIDKAQFSAVLSELFRPETMLVAYNAQFDLLFLYEFLAKHGDARLLRGLPKLDLLTLYRDRCAYPHRLENAIAHYGLSDCVTNSHRAIDDVRATLAVMHAMQTERDDLANYIDLFGYSAKYGVSGPRIGSVTYRPQGYEPSPTPLYEA